MGLLLGIEHLMGGNFNVEPARQRRETRIYNRFANFDFLCESVSYLIIKIDLHNLHDALVIPIITPSHKLEDTPHSVSAFSESQYAIPTIKTHQSS